MAISNQESSTMTQDPPTQIRRLITNLTPKRIIISRTNKQEGQFEISPFGIRELSSDEIVEWDWKPLEDRGLIRTEVLVPLVAKQSRWDSIKGRFKWLATGLKRSTSFIVILVITIGLPVLMNGWLLEDTKNGKPAIAWFAYAPIGIFIAIASMLPAILFYLFVRQQWRSARNNILRQIVWLDPNAQTLADAEAMYGELIEDYYASNESGFAGRLQITLLISVILITLGWSLTFLPTSGRLQVIFNPTIIACFLGAYLFSINMIFRRYVRGDLVHKAYSHVSMRIIVAFIIVWICDLLLVSANGVGALDFTRTIDLLFSETTLVSWPAWVIILSFFVGVFPDSGLNYLKSRMRNSGIGLALPPDERLPLEKLEGITPYDQARFLEEGIENIENLAHNNIVELMCQTRIPIERLIFLIDQAKLYLQCEHSLQADEPEKPE
jgi:hypothetical protein